VVFKVYYEEPHKNEDKEKRDECKMTQTDSEGKSNLCCCYILDDEGQYKDACYLPADECCR
jgi:hypothetical protein